MQSVYIRGIRNILSGNVFLIAAAWSLGLLAGCFFLSQTLYISLMRSVHFVRMSIVDLLISLALPLLLSSFCDSLIFFSFCLLCFLKPSRLCAAMAVP